MYEYISVTFEQFSKTKYTLINIVLHIIEIFQKISYDI